ncbi:thioesterase superfamily protein [mine drainage metagenome]|uniref:Thioesterase superfamily protein n=2 Tax=mine drainage metagenome TaxID=410659 RepID=T1BVE1_9ZZZZ
MHFETPPHDRAATVSTLAMPKDTNGVGDIFGGWLMSHADIAGAILAYRIAGGRVVTVAVNEFVFLRPVYVGDIVSFYTDLKRIGRTSVTIDVSVFVQRPTDPGEIESHLVSTAQLTYVHIDENQRPSPIDPMRSPSRQS